MATRVDSGDHSQPRIRGFVGSFLSCALLFALPFGSVEIPPITDLSQQVAQIYLLHEGSADYRVNGPHHPNKLSYLVLALWYSMVDPVLAGKLTVYSIGVTWLAAVHLLAFVQGRSPLAAALAGLIFFNHLTYWGFLNFTLGFAVFVGWFLLLRHPGLEGRSRVSPILGVALLIGACALFSAHVLWLIVGIMWLAVATVGVDLGRLPELGKRLLWIAPAALGLVLWWLHVYSATATSLSWGLMPWQRLDPRWLVANSLGGLRGSVEPLLALMLVTWAALGLIGSRSRAFSQLREIVQRPARSAGLVGLMLALLALLLPTYLLHTTAFAGRWLPPAIAFLLVSCPLPRVQPVIRATLVWVMVVSLVVATTAAWRNFEHVELAGLDQCLEALPPDQLVLGLAFTVRSPTVAGYPFHHIYAWAQPLKGAQLNRSFASEPVALVTYRERDRDIPWTDGLDFYPRKFTAADRDFFDYIIVSAVPRIHEQFLRDPRLEPMTPELPWRLYRVVEGG